MVRKELLGGPERNRFNNARWSVKNSYYIARKVPLYFPALLENKFGTLRAIQYTILLHICTYV